MNLRVLAIVMTVIMLIICLVTWGPFREGVRNSEECTRTNVDSWWCQVVGGK